MRQIDATLKAELLELLALASLQTLPDGSRKLVAGYLAAMAELLDDAHDPYVEAAEAEHAARSLCIERGTHGGPECGCHELARTPAQRAHAEAFGELSPYFVGDADGG